MKKERKIIGKEPLIRFKLSNCSTDQGWMFTLRLMLRRTGRKKINNLKTQRSIAVWSSRHMTRQEKINLGYRVYHHIQNNPDFALITPRPDELLMALHAFEEANNQFNNGGSAMERKILKVREESFDDVFRALLSYINWIARGSEAVFRSAGLLSNKKS